MISVSIKKANKISEIIVFGHAEYDKSGKDIVCAAVSTALIVSVNLIEKFNINIKTEKKDGYFMIKRIVDDNKLDIILDNLEYSLRDLELQFPKYIKINS